MPIGGSKSVLAAALLVGGSLPTSGNRTGVLPVPRRLEYYPADTSLFSTGSRSAGTGRDDWHIGGAITVDLERSALPLPVQFHLNAGSRKTSALTPDDEQFYDVFFAGAGFEGKISKYVSLLGEYWHEDRLESTPGTDAQLDDISVGLNFHTPVGISVLLGAAFALDNSEVSPISFYNGNGAREYDFNMRTSADAQILLALSYTARLSSIDKDGDGILDKDDKCPEIPEDKDGFEDEDGCPEDDNDHDGITDKKDKCPNDPEDKDGFEDEDGCPDVDNDKDTLCDPWVMGREMVAKYASVCRPTDKCPNEPQGPGGVDGCPNGDTDGDGIMNDKDKCPTDPEDKDGFQDDDGCPEPDNDGDGILDPQDKCPDQPEVRNGFQDEDGCPDEAPVQQKTLLLRGVNFETAKAVLLPESYPILDDVAAQLVAIPEIEIEVSGHTDDRGGAEYNMRLSQDRAQSVATYLIQKGVAQSRMRVKGYGFSKPIASNRTADGRLQNRRVEFNRVK
jgi:outer membrane protein OmpA-like peptidoglycan-associated protein